MNKNIKIIITVLELTTNVLTEFGRGNRAKKNRDIIKRKLEYDDDENFD